MLDSFTVNLQNVKESYEHSAVVRLLAASLIDNPYYTIGNFFKNLSNDDLNSLLEKTEAIGSEEEDIGVEDLVLITMMLAQAEGNPITDEEELAKCVSVMSVFIAGTSLARKGFVKAFYENMSFGQDMMKAIIFKKLPYETTDD